ncbi:hypothetical protein OHAE_1381 [Ochrobactrum soli]|uniref:Uncharacterized protein n=1 Tax=Ochrobactrum soli TaxID=2448455 RepID=A0A2P9HN55_9HYPH|nr:hypothetical protein OHAE_1381 [[Ochrobactrum] soli]
MWLGAANAAGAEIKESAIAAAKIFLIISILNVFSNSNIYL